ncbi:amidase [Brevibacterium sp. BRM-1]|uniref:amidase n=1 Tax=Brevibacterium sp. BRM-1 TaxID=2999062 RepID=UPI0022806821|nr:amidase [Brevibacterium sp. BRM-1]WAL40061.1 amidase [Brevibacterium sp. BRM-1]
MGADADAASPDGRGSQAVRGTEPARGAELARWRELCAAYPDLSAQLAGFRSGRLDPDEFAAACSAAAEVYDPIVGAFLERCGASDSRGADRGAAHHGEVRGVGASEGARAGDGTSAGEAGTASEGALGGEAARAGEPGALAGARLGIKALIAVREAVPTGQSRVFDPAFSAGADAAVVARLRAAGAGIAGTTTMAEHAAGRPDPALDFPLPRNPWDLGCWPGGSSCGTAIGIALGLFPAGLGTDTSGSCRIPAAFCGITGLRPTHGALPVDGILPAAPSLDVVGPMARSARDCRLLFDIMRGGPGTASAAAGLPSAAAPEGRADGGPAGASTADGGGTAAQAAGPAARTGDGAADRRIGVPAALLDDPRMAPAVAEAFREALRELETAGAILVEVPAPDIDAMIGLTLLVMVREMYDSHRATLGPRWHEYGRSFRRLAALGAFVDDAAYTAALAAGKRAGGALEALFAEAGLAALALPTWPQPAPPYTFAGGTPQDDWNLTAPVCITGHPALALPMGLVPEGSPGAGLPVSLQLIGARGGEDAILALGEAFQERTAHHLLVPALDPDAVTPPVSDPDGDVVAHGKQGEAADSQAGGAGAVAAADVRAALAAAGLPADASDVRAIAPLAAAMRSGATALGARASDVE